MKVGFVCAHPLTIRALYSQHPLYGNPSLMTASTQQLGIWRKQAADRIHSLMTQFTGDELHLEDAQADTLLRQLSNLPARPSDRTPYAGIFPESSLSVARVKTANRLKQLILDLKGDSLQPPDGWVDELLRSLLKLPARGSNQPYVDIFPDAVLPQITLDQLLRIAIHASASRVEELTPYLLDTMAKYDISTPLRQAHFLAQIIHESGSFHYVEEIDAGDYLEYRTDLGNTEPGDGPRYKGRGLIQITGRSNYAACGEALGVDLLNQPSRLAENDLACLCAGWFWEKNRINEFADQDNVERVTQIINGGFNGFEERKEFLQIARDVLGV
jgi:putative chitinase